MDLGDSFRDLADVIDAVEASSFDIESIAPGDDSLIAEDGLAVQLSGTVPILDETAVGEKDGVELTAHSAGITDDGEIQVELSVRVSQASSDQVEKSEGSDTEDGDEIPVHRDPEQLRTVYEEHDTFEEMREALGVEVTWNTVRRQMIKHDIHDPETTGDSETGDDADADDSEEASPEASDTESVADGGQAKAAAEEPNSSTSMSGTALPEGLTVDELVEVLEQARTVDEVRQQLDLYNISAYRLLNDLDLIDPATGELTSNAAEEFSSRT